MARELIASIMLAGCGATALAGPVPAARASAETRRPDIARQRRNRFRPGIVDPLPLLRRHLATKPWCRSPPQSPNHLTLLLRGVRPEGCLVRFLGGGMDLQLCLNAQQLSREHHTYCGVHKCYQLIKSCLMRFMFLAAAGSVAISVT